jgi:hypothetical protein
MIKLNQLLKEETFTATNKATGKTSVFKTKDSRDAAIKAGTHDAIKDKEQPSAPKAVGSDMFGGDYAKDRGGEAPKADTTSAPKKERKGNPQINKEAKKKAEEYGITPQKLGNDGYKKTMLKAAVEALTDANFHDEARELISKIEGKPEWAKRVDYPKMDDPKYKEKMADIRSNGVDSSEYWNGDDNAHEYGRNVSQASGWDGVQAADGIAFTLRMNGFHKEADTIQSIFDNKPYMKNEGTMKLTKLMENDPCWKGYKQVGMKDKNGREVPNCVPESVVKEAGIPKLYLKIEAVKNKIKALEAERKSKYGGEYAKKLNAETDPKKKHELAQPIFAITKQIAAQQKNLFNMLDMEEKYYANMGKDDELDPNFA